MNENVRKVFDMLGVEPNERFKIEGIEEANYYIDEKLYVIREIKERLGNVSECDKGLSNILNGNFKIIKLPKSNKLRDWTYDEFVQWKENNCYNDESINCNDCIFKNVNCSRYEANCWVNHKDLYSDKFLDQEIEVE